MAKDYAAAENIKSLQDKGMSERDAILVSMKRTKAEKKGKSGASISSTEREDYPYGLSISLDAETIKKLGLSEDLQVGDVVELRAKAKVRSMSQSSSEEGGENRDLSLQITDLCVEDEGEEAAESDDDEAEEDAEKD